MNYLELINYGSRVLKKNKIPSHILDSEILLSKTLNKARALMAAAKDSYKYNQ